LQQAARNRGLFYPPDPASLKDSSIGGNIATNAGGPRCFKYGVTRHYVLGLEIVLMGGEILRVGSRTVKNKTGFDIMGLFVGSEGMLGVVTEATLRLLPHPPNQAVLVATFDKMQQAIDAVNRVQHAGFIPSALEISDGITLDCARKFFKNTPRGNAWVLVEVDGQHGTVKEEIRILGKLFKSLKPVTLLTSQGAQSEKLWDIRRSMSTSLKALGLKKLNEDITVPRSRFMELFKLTERLQKKSGFAIASFGHAGDGNIHVNIMVPPREKDVDPLLDALFKQVLKWNGCITGEHGIGLAKKPWWPQAVSPLSHRIHRQIKKNLDPHNLLNPGKFLG
jgi:glycolate oxidase